MLELTSPTRLNIGRDIPEDRLDFLRGQLEFHDKRVDYEVKRLVRYKDYWVKKLGPEEFAEQLATLKAEARKSLLYHDDAGYWTLSGLRNDLAAALGESISFQQPPRGSPLAWREEPQKVSRDYQVAAATALLASPQPAAVEMGTGLGKSFILLNLIQQLGLRTLIMAPGTQIADQLYEEFSRYLGSDRVGAYFDGKKEHHKLITIGNSQSLTRVETDSPAWRSFRRCQVFAVDESHLCPAETLQKVCIGLADQAPWRFFFSGTQLRHDGLTLLLRGIIGGTVYSMTVQQGVDQGWLARPKFYMFQTTSPSYYRSDDAQKMNRIHLLENPNVLAIAAQFTNMSHTHLGKQVLILIEELSQFQLLRQRLQVPCALAHGPLTKTSRKEVPEDQWDFKPKQLVQAFNEGKLPVLIGTSCISTGTDILPVKVGINLRGGTSEIEARQGVGRCTRKSEGKDDFQFLDFNVMNVPMISNQAKARGKLYQQIYPDFTETPYA